MKLNEKGRRGFVVHVDLDQPVRALEVPVGYDVVVIIVHLHGTVLGQLTLPAHRMEPDELATHITTQLWPLILRSELRHTLRAKLGRTTGAVVDAPRPTVAVIVCTRDRPEQLRDCVASLLELNSPADEIVIVDNSPSDERTRDLCRDLPVRYVLEPVPGQTRARNRGIVESTSELIAYTDDDCIVDSRWLDSLQDAFSDPLTMAATGYIGPYELSHPAQFVFEAHMGFERYPEPRVFDPRMTSPLMAAASAGAGANMVFRRQIFERVGMFAEDLGPGTPARSSDDKYAFYRVLAAGFRIRYDPARIVWHRHRADTEALRRIMEDYGVAEFAYTTRCLVEHREASAMRIWAWWLRHYARDFRRALAGAPDAVPLGVTLAEIGGAVRGPWAMRESARSRAGIPPIAFRKPLATREVDRESARIESVTADWPECTVTIASRNRRDSLGRVLTALSRQDYPADKLEVRVVLDGTKDDSATMVKSFDAPYALHVVEQEHRGLAATRNHGARTAVHPLVIFLDDDIEPVEGFLKEHANAHRDGPEEMLVMGAYPPARLGDRLWEMSVRAWWTDHFRRKSESDHQWSFADFIDGNASVSRGLFERLGGFDERFKGGRRQDWELGIRMLQAGVPFAFRPGARGDHMFDTRLETGVRNARQEGQYDVLIARQHPEAKWQLPLRRFRLTPGSRLPRSLTVPLADPAIAAALIAAEGLERAHQRRRWFKLVNRLLTLSYVSGLRDALGSNAELTRFLEWEGPSLEKTVEIALDGGLEPAPLSRVAPEDIVLRVGGAPVARLPALGGDGQWDPDELIDRVVNGVGTSLTVELARAQLYGNR